MPKSRGGEGNKIKKDIAFLSKCRFKFNGNNNRIIIEGVCRLKNCRFIINGDNNIINIKSSVATGVEFYIEDDNNCLIVNDNTSFCGKAHIALIEGTCVEFGRNCLLSSDIVVRTGDSHSVLDLCGNRTNQSENVSIGDHVWIGNKVIITKGVTIPKDCIIGTGSVVTRKFSRDGVVIAGNPAKVVKENVNWDTKRI